MKLLLTSAGIRNASLHAALLDLLGKPIADCRALCIPTAMHGHPDASPEAAWRFVAGREPATPMCELGWKSVGLLELAALPSLEPARWQPWIREADVLLAAGGDAVYLGHWMRRSGVADLLAAMPGKVWVGLSAGSMVAAPRIGEAFVAMKPSITGDDRTLGWIDCAIFPHLNHPGFAGNTMAEAEKWAAGIGHPAYAIDDETGLKVVDGRVEVVSEGRWKFFAP